MVTLTRKQGIVCTTVADHRKVATLHGVKPHDFFGVVSGATGDVRCVVCGKPLTDALSVERMIGPKCFGDHYEEAPALNKESFAKVAGMIVALDSRVNTTDGAIDEDVIDFILAHPNDSRAVANILVAWGSVNARKGARAKVLAVTPILRELGYPTLADRLEKDRAPFHLFVEGSTVYLRASSEDAWKLRRKLPWVGVKPVQCREKGRTRYLMVPTADKAVLWAVLKHQFEGAALSIEGKGLAILPAVSAAERDMLNKRDINNKPVKVVKAAPQRVLVKRDADRLLLNSPPPWESQEASVFIEGVRAINGRRWHAQDKHWSVPRGAVQQLEDAAKASGMTLKWA